MLVGALYRLAAFNYWQQWGSRCSSSTQLRLILVVVVVSFRHRSPLSELTNDIKCDAKGKKVFGDFHILIVWSLYVCRCILIEATNPLRVQCFRKNVVSSGMLVQGHCEDTFRQHSSARWLWCVSQTPLSRTNTTIEGGEQWWWWWCWR